MSVLLLLVAAGAEVVEVEVARMTPNGVGLLVELLAVAAAEAEEVGAELGLQSSEIRRRLMARLVTIDNTQK